MALAYLRFRRKALPHTCAILFLVLVWWALLSACQSSKSPATPIVPGITVGITDGICPNVIVKVGDQVTWRNDGKQEHVVRLVDADGVSKFDSGVLIPGYSASMTFTEAAVYTYACTADGSMKGTVTVNP